MAELFREVEIKLRFESPEAASGRLEAQEATLRTRRHFEENVLFEREMEPLKSAKKMLRLRSAGGIFTLTLKAAVPGKHRHKVREEYETAVADPAALTLILERLGFSPTYRYQKYRTVYDLEGVLACLDETPLGTFIELEGEPELIDQAAARLGFNSADFIRASYRALHKAAVKRNEIADGDLLFTVGGGGAQR